MVYNIIDNILQSIERKKLILDNNRPFLKALMDNLLEWFKIELTYSSNAIEGNTLTRMETALVIEKGITIGGKRLKEHLEATNHAKAFDFILSLLNRQSILESDILAIHRIILSNIEEEYAGKYRENRVKISGSDVIFPNYQKIPELISKMCGLINDDIHPLDKVLFAHYELVTIHPFIDGNGRTARLLMNLILMQNGYPPAIIRPKDRLQYLKALEEGQLGGSQDSYKVFMLKSIDRSTDIYINSVENKVLPAAPFKQNLLKIGDFAKSSDETIATIRYWVKIGLIEVADKLESGYQLFNKKEVRQCKKIRALSKERFTLEEIAGKLSKK
jgi:Fic family protein